MEARKWQAMMDGIVSSQETVMNKTFTFFIIAFFGSNYKLLKTLDFKMSVTRQIYQYIIGGEGSRLFDIHTNNMHFIYTLMKECMVISTHNVWGSALVHFFRC